MRPFLTSEALLAREIFGGIDWVTLADHFADRPPLVLFDGYDELLQATGKVFSSYLNKVQQFQERELANERQPVRTIVTSRITLIDKAVIPPGATIIRLLEFDQKRQNTWMSIWNSANVAYFQQAEVKPFELPEKNKKINELAKQPLLLMMLALFDSNGNQLREAKTLDQTLLYDNLLRQFIERELKKEERFQFLEQTELDKAIGLEMERLGIVAIGMFNRRSLSIHLTQLNTDLKYFELEREVQNIGGGYPLSQAELLLGSFFFVQESKSVRKSQGFQGRESDTAFEFLHNTFGEFLTADFMLRKILKETNIVYQLKNNKDLQELLSTKTKQIDGLEPGWFARFMYTPLFSRPVIITLMREWLRHCLQKNKRDEEEFLEGLDSIVTSHIQHFLNGNTLPTLMTSDQRPFIDLPTTGYIAIYTLNLVLLKSILSSEGYTFDETFPFTSTSGMRTWDRLTYLWRSWFSLETLNELAAILVSRRDGTKIHLKIKDSFGISSSNNRLALIRNVSQALADNVTAGLSGILLHDSWHADRVELDDISKKLLSEQIDLREDVITKQLRHVRRENIVPPHQEILSLLSEDFSRRDPPDMRDRWTDNSETLASFIAEVNKIALTSSPDILEAINRWLPGFGGEVLTDELSLECLRLARETGHGPALRHYSDRYVNEQYARRKENLSVPFIIELSELARDTPDSFIPNYLRHEYNELIQGSQGYVPRMLVVEMIRLARHFGDKEILDYIYHTYLNRMLTFKEIQEYMDADLVIELIMLAREYGDEVALPSFIRYLKKKLPKGKQYPRSTRNVPTQLLIEVIGFAREMSTQEMITKIFSEYVRQLIQREVYMPTELVIELVKLIREVGDQETLMKLGYHLKRLLSQKEHMPLEAIVEMIKYAREIDDREILDYFGRDYLRDMLQTQRLVPVILAVELIKLAQEAGGHNQADIESFYHKNITMDRCYLSVLSLDTIADIRRLAKEFDDNDLLNRINQKLGLGAT